MGLSDITQNLFGQNNPSFFDSPVIDTQPTQKPRLETDYDTARGKYLNDLITQGQKVNKKALKFFDDRWNEGAWDRGMQETNDKFTEIENRMRQRSLDDQIRNQENKSRMYEQQGYTFDGTNWNAPQVALKTPKNWNQIALDNKFTGIDQVKEFQRVFGLTEDGKAGNNTLGMLADLQKRNPGMTISELIKREISGMMDGNNAVSTLEGAPQQDVPVTQTSADPLMEKYRGWLKHDLSSNPNVKTTTYQDGTKSYLSGNFRYYNNGRVLNLQTKKMGTIAAPTGANKGFNINWDKRGGVLNKYQQGGQMGNQEELQKAFMAFLVQDAQSQGIQIQTEEDFQSYIQQLGEEGLAAKQQEFMQKMQGGQMARLGAKLQYYKSLKGSCPEGQEMVFFKEGGRICKACQGKKMEDGGQTPKKKKNAVEEFKSKRKHINTTDTIHHKGEVYDLTGKHKQYKKMDKKTYKKLPLSKKNDVDMKDLDAGRSVNSTW